MHIVKRHTYTQTHTHTYIGVTGSANVSHNFPNSLTQTSWCFFTFTFSGYTSKENIIIWKVEMEWKVPNTDINRETEIMTTPLKTIFCLLLPYLDVWASLCGMLYAYGLFSEEADILCSVVKLLEGKEVDVFIEWVILHFWWKMCPPSVMS